MAWICGNPPLSILSIRSVTIHRGRAEVVPELLECPGETGVLEGALLDLADGVHDGGVVAAVEGLRNRRQGEIGELAGQVHRKLTRPGYGGGSAGGEQGVDGDGEALGDGLLDA